MEMTGAAVRGRTDTLMRLKVMHRCLPTAGAASAGCGRQLAAQSIQLEQHAWTAVHRPARGYG